MKKLLVTLCAVMFCVAVKVSAENYSGVLSTFTVASNTTTFASLYPIIAGGVKIDRLQFSTTEALTVPILVSVYDNATSTTIAGTAANTDQGFWIIPSSPTIAGEQSYTQTYTWPFHNPRKYTNPAFYMKSGGGTDLPPAKVIYIDIDYR